MTRPRRTGKRAPGTKQLDPARRAHSTCCVRSRTRLVCQPGPARCCANAESRAGATSPTELTYGTCRTRACWLQSSAKAARASTERIDPRCCSTCCGLGAYRLLRTRVRPTPRCPPRSSRLHRIRRVQVSSTECCGPSRATSSRGSPSARCGPGRPRRVQPYPAGPCRRSPVAGADARDAQAAAGQRRRKQPGAAWRPGRRADRRGTGRGGRRHRRPLLALHGAAAATRPDRAVREATPRSQDEQSWWRALTLTPARQTRRGRWLDLCARPGSKTRCSSIGAHPVPRVVAVRPGERRANWSSRTRQDSTSRPTGSTAANPASSRASAEFWSTRRVQVSARCAAAP